LLLILLFAAPARAAQCGGDFNVFLFPPWCATRKRPDSRVA
jgi:hypothetical protein